MAGRVGRVSSSVAPGPRRGGGGPELLFDPSKPAGPDPAREEVFGCLLRLSARFHQGANAGDLIYRASWDTYSIQTLFQQGLMAVAGASLSLLLMAAVMARLNGALTLVALALAPLLVMAIRVFGRPMRERATLAQQADSRVTSLVRQSIAHLALTQSYTREEFEAGRFQAEAGEAQDKRLAQHGSELAYGLAVALVFGIGTAAITLSRSPAGQRRIIDSGPAFHLPGLPGPALRTVEPVVARRRDGRRGAGRSAARV